MIRHRIALVYWVIAIGFFMPGAVYAYIDPATTTYIVQIITALVVTVGVSLSIFMYRFRMISAKIRYGAYGLLYRLMHGGRRRRAAPAGARGGVARADGGGLRDVDGVAGGGEACGGVAGDGVLPGAARPPSEEEMAALGQPADIEKIPRKESKPAPGERDYFGRLRAAIPVCLALCLSFVLIGCIDLVVHNPTDILFPLSGVMPVLLLATAVCFVILIFIIPLFRGRAFALALAVAATVLIAGYLQGTFFNRGLGELDGGDIAWGLHKAAMAGSVVLWLAVFIVAFLLLRYSKPGTGCLLIFIPLLLIIIQGAGFVSLTASEAGGGRGTVAAYWEESPERLTFQGVFELASEKNVIIIILDRFDQSIVDEIIAEDPHFFDELDGFTMFDDNISYSAKTFPVVTEMLTGYRFRWGESDSDFFKKAWAGPNFLNALMDTGVDVRLYTVMGFVYDDVEQIRGAASNIGEIKEVINSRIALVKLLKLSAFRYAPMPLKHMFWMAPDEFQHAVVFTGETMPYLNNDFAFYDSLTEERLSVSDSSSAFTFIHLNGPHPPLNMDENINLVEKSTLAKQAIGSTKIAYEYLRQLKGLGLYDDATIIIMADHGIPEDINKPSDRLTKPVNAVLFVKPSGSAGTPLAVSHAPVCPDQLPGTVMEGFFGNGNAGEFGPGYFGIEEGAAVIREYLHRNQLYEISGDGREFENWYYIREFQDEWGSKAR